MSRSDTWICVADSARAKFFRCDGPGRDIEPMLKFSMNGPARPQNPDLERSRMADRIAGQLNRAAEDHLFEHLVLVAPPGMLEPLEKTLGAQTRQMVSHKYGMDLTRLTPREVARHICEALPH